MQRQINELKKFRSCIIGQSILPVTTLKTDEGYQMYMGEGSDPVVYVPTMKESCVG